MRLANSAGERSRSVLMSMAPIQPQVDFVFNHSCIQRQLNGWQNQSMVTDVGKAIQAALDRLGKTQAWLAEEAGVSNNAVSKWINLGKISAKNIPKAALILGIDPRQLLGVPVPPDSPNRTLYPTPADARDIEHIGHQFTAYEVDPAVHDEAPVRTERLMAGDIPEHEFTWIAEDDEMAGGDRPVMRGYRVVIEPRAIPEPGKVALIQIGDRRPVLREIKDNGAFWYIAGKSNLDPVKLVDGEYRIIGLMATAHFPRIPLHIKPHKNPGKPAPLSPKTPGTKALRRFAVESDDHGLIRRLHDQNKETKS